MEEASCFNEIVRVSTRPIRIDRDVARAAHNATLQVLGYDTRMCAIRSCRAHGFATPVERDVCDFCKSPLGDVQLSLPI